VKLNPDTIRDILLRIESELKAGHKVFLVGRFPLSETARPVSITPTPESESGWRLGIYLNLWRSQMVNLLGQHAVQVVKIALNERQPIDPQEKEDVFVFSGWKD
jgi:hypothetical protein